MDRSAWTAQFGELLECLCIGESSFDPATEDDPSRRAIGGRNAKGIIARLHPRPHGYLARAEVDPALKPSRYLLQGRLLIIGLNRRDHVDKADGRPLGLLRSIAVTHSSHSKALPLLGKR